MKKRCYIKEMARADALFQLRLPEHLRKKLEEQANKKKQSLTSEILNRLEESFSNDSDKILELVERIAALEKAVFYKVEKNEHPITKYRKIHGWTMQELSKKADISMPIIHKIELGENRPKGEYLLKLSIALEVPIEKLIKELEDFLDNK